MNQLNNFLKAGKLLNKVRTFALFFLGFFAVINQVSAYSNPTSVTLTITGTSWTATWPATGDPHYYVSITTLSTFDGTWYGGLDSGNSTTRSGSGLTPGATYYVYVTGVSSTWAWSGATQSNAVTVDSNRPTISSFTPATGAVGTSVVITGTNFNTTASNNIVFFGATKATVSAATATSLTVTVPAGATYQNISVVDITSRLSATSSKPFITTFTGAATLIAGSFATKIDITTPTGPYNVSVGDLDGDGKADIVITNSGNGSISIYRNTSTTGSVTLDAKADITVGSMPFNTAIGDLDGDGKLDLAVSSNGSNSVSVLRNTSSSGSISFAAKTDYTTESGSVFIAIGDLNNDGKPDLVSVNYSGKSLSLFNNTSTAGAISFAAKSDITGLNTYPYSIALGDIDGDGLTDLAVANNSNPGTASILRNTNTTKGVFSFSAKSDFSTTNGLQTIALGDLDGDGKKDILAGGTTACVLRNTSTSGTISLAAKTDITTGANPYNVAVAEINGDGKPDIVSSNLGGANGSVMINSCTSGSISFATNVNYSAGASPRGLAIGDLDNDGKPDIMIVNGSETTFSILRNKTAPAPAISTFTPALGMTGTVVTISGTNFTGATAVSFGGTAAASFKVVSATSITAEIAAGTSGDISVTTPGGTVTQAGFTYYTGTTYNATSPALNVSTNNFALLFNTGIIPTNATVVLTMTATSNTSNDSRDVIWCGSNELTSLNNMDGLYYTPASVSFDISASAKGHNLSTEEILYSARVSAPNVKSSFYYGNLTFSKIAVSIYVPTTTSTPFSPTASEQLKVYKAGNSNIHIETLKAGDVIEYCKVTNMQGKVLTIKNVNKAACDLNIELSKGVYLITTKTNQGIYTQKFIY